MCTGAEIPIGLAIIGGATQVASSVAAGNAQANAAERQAKIDEQNAATAQTEATLAVRDAEFKAGQIAEGASRLEAQQRQASVANGIDPTAGTAASTTADTALVASNMESMARLEGARAAYGYRTQGLQYQSIANARRANASDFSTAGWLGAAGTAIGAAGKVYGMASAAGWFDKAAAPAGGGSYGTAAMWGAG